MPPGESDDIERLKHELYSRNRKLPAIEDVRTPLNPSTAEAPVAWTKEEEPIETSKPVMIESRRKKMSMPAKFLIGSVAFFVLAAGAAAYMFYGGGNLISPQNIDIQVITPSLVDSGKEQSFQILITNHNASALTLVDLVIDYPEGTRDPKDPTKALQHERQSIGTIGAGQQIKRTANAILYGSEGSSHKLKATLEYSVANSNAVFQKGTEA